MRVLGSDIRVHSISIQQVDTLMVGIQDLLNVDVPILGLATDLLVLVDRIDGAAL